MAARHVLSIADLGAETLTRLVADGAAIARGEWDTRKPLQGKVVGIYFKKSSTRTRTSFTVGAMKLGASTLAYGLLPRMHLTIVTPEGYGIPQEVIDQARGFARSSGSTIEQHHDMEALPQGPDVVYSTRWLTMGVQKKDADWLDRFRPYTITPQV